MIIDLYAAVCAGDLKEAMGLQTRINPLKDAVYGDGEPTGDAHARMKMAMYLAGILQSPTVQPPTQLPTGREPPSLRRAESPRGHAPRWAGAKGDGRHYRRDQQVIGRWKVVSGDTAQ